MELPDVEVPITKKDPKRVEQGKRLAMISKEAKERKMRAKIEAELREKQGAPFTDLFPLSYAYYGGVGVTSSIFFLGLWWWWNKKEEKRNDVVVEKQEIPVDKIENKFVEL